jgi:AcrR family transcriptional regulator
MTVSQLPAMATKTRALRDEDKLERRRQILDAAEKLFRERPEALASMDDLADAAGVAKGTLYLYFPSKQSLLEEALRRYSLRPDVEAGLARLRGLPLGDVVRGLVAVTWRGLEARRELAGVLLRELPNHPEEARRFLEQVILPLNRLLADYLREVLPPERAARLDPVVAARSLLGMVLVFFVSQEVLGGAELLPIPEERILATIAELFLRGAEGRPAA